jgi:hypothetical protein
VKPAPHTPGPWKVYQEKPHYYSVGTDYAHDRGHDCNIVRDIRCEANARVMAAAPELLDALEASLPNLEWANIHGSRCEELLNQTKAAIRKARGC